MASPQTLDVEALLVPVPGENPAGEFLRYAGPYDAIQEARRADEDLPQGEWRREAKTADWATVTGLATEALATKSKDLQIAAWLVEALVKRHGFPGLRDGLRLLRELQEHFWAFLYPAITDGDVEFRTGPLEWLNDKLPVSIKGVIITQGEHDYSWFHWEESRAVDNLGRQSQEAMAAAISEGRITGEQFDKAVAAAPRPYYETLFDDLRQSREEFNRLERAVEEKFAREAPSLSGIKKAIDDCIGLVERIVKNKRELDPDYKPAEESPAGQPEGVANLDQKDISLAGELGGGGLSLEPKNREEALQRLAAIAAYWRRVEPQSPVSYLVERAVRWGKMPLEMWLREVIQNDDVLSHLQDTLGIKESQTP